MRKNLILALALGMVAVLPASAVKFFDKSSAAELFNIGVRAGINTSNTTISKNVYDKWNCNAWGTGVDLGVVADLNFKNYLSVQPGFFFESRSGKYNYVSTMSVSEAGTEYMTQFGNLRSYNFVVPVMGCVHFNLSDDVRWNVEFGPYFRFILKNKVNDELVYPVYAASDALPTEYMTAHPSKFDFGFKFGTSLKVLGHYLVGVHYEGGALKPWTNGDLGGRYKAWVFSVGYDF